MRPSLHIVRDDEIRSNKLRSLENKFDFLINLSNCDSNTSDHLILDYYKCPNENHKPFTVPPAWKLSKPLLTVLKFFDWKKVIRTVLTQF